MRNKRLSLTLTELIMVVVIIGVLACLAVVGFNRSREHAYLRQAKDDLSLINDAEQQYYLKTSNYVLCANTIDCNNKVRLSLYGNTTVAAENAAWNYSVTAAANGTAYAVRAYGSYNGCTYGLALGVGNNAAYSSGNCP